MSTSKRSAAMPLKRDAIRMNRHRALGCCLSMIFSENRCALFRIMLYRFAINSSAGAKRSANVNDFAW
ncbi:hypothetical protein CV770_05870 [Bradyrhizobium sp. AC87j1]|nr:hypothetical protein CV770_05870 [Bradyrhizobium sp. AC87j1]